MPHVLFKFD